MTTLEERIGGERRRLHSVRLKLSAAVAQGASGDTDWTPFYIAVGDYMGASIGRVLAQDIKMGDLVREKVEVVDENVTAALAALDQTMSDLGQRLNGLLAARDNLRSDGDGALTEFEDAGRELTDYIVANLGHQTGGVSGLARELFGPDDWEYMAGITDEDMAREVEFFEQVNSTTPANLELPPAD